MVESAWSLLPPIITIVLALATKEVYMSLIVGIFVGALMFTGFDLLAAIDTFFAIMSDKVGGNVYILVFLVLLGIIVAAIARSGASRAYGEWAASVIRGKRSSFYLRGSYLYR
jgi:tetracycline resistance efflux pump